MRLNYSITQEASEKNQEVANQQHETSETGNNVRQVMDCNPYISLRKLSQ